MSLARLLLLLACACVGLAGCGGSDGVPGEDAERAERTEREGPTNEQIADDLAHGTKLDRDQADALVASQDAAIRPRGLPPGWREQDDGMWMREFEGGAAFVMVSSYPVGYAPELTAAALLEVTRKQLREYSTVEPTFHREQVGTFLGRPGSAKLDYASVSPGGNEIEHVQYIVRIGARVYNLVGGTQVSTWRRMRPEIERVIASFDLEHPEPGQTRVPPGMASPDESKVQPIFAGASAREVQDAIATWSYTPDGEDKPWFPVLVECEQPTSRVPDAWDCTVDFFRKDGFEDDIPVRVETSASGRWRAEVDA